MTAENIVTLYITAPDLETAGALARTMVEEQLAACANLFPGMTSVYRWEGKVQEESEVVVLLKTRVGLRDAAIRRVEELHPYDVPCVVAWESRGGNEAYLRWVQSETLGPPPKIV